MQFLSIPPEHVLLEPIGMNHFYQRMSLARKMMENKLFRYGISSSGSMQSTAA